MLALENKNSYTLDLITKDTGRVVATAAGAGVVETRTKPNGALSGSVLISRTELRQGSSLYCSVPEEK